MVEIELELDEDIILWLTQEANKLNISINDYINSFINCTGYDIWVK